MATRATTQQHEPATKAAPQYKTDDGPLSALQLRQIRKLTPQGKMRSLRSSLFERLPTKR